MEPEIEIRQLQESDSIDELTKLINRSYRERADAGYNMTGSYQDARETASRISSGVCFVAIQSEKLVGTGLLLTDVRDNFPREYKAEGVGVLSQLCVDPDSRSQGIGKLLISAIEQEALARNLDKLMLDTVETATALVQYYRGIGFTDLSHFQWPGKTYRSLIMVKNLKSN